VGCAKGRATHPEGGTTPAQLAVAPDAAHTCSSVHPAGVRRAGEPCCSAASAESDDFGAAPLCGRCTMPMRNQDDPYPPLCDLVFRSAPDDAVARTPTEADRKEFLAQAERVRDLARSRLGALALGSSDVLSEVQLQTLIDNVDRIESEVRSGSLPPSLSTAQLGFVYFLLDTSEAPQSPLLQAAAVLEQLYRTRF
jgi:hypothetical protein